MAVRIQLRRDTAANWASNNPVLAQGEIGLETDTNQFKIGNGTSLWSALSYGGIQGPAQTSAIQDFGNGEDGDITLSAGITTLSADVYYNNLTLTGAAQIRTNGFRIFVKNNLDLSAAGVDAITLSGLDGGAASLATGGSAGTTYTAATVGASTAGGAGATGVVGVGAQAAVTTATTPSNGGASGTGGAGGTGASGAGGTARAGVAPTVPCEFPRFAVDLIRGVTLMQAGCGAPGGSSGAGDGTNTGRGGGGGGAGGGIVYIAAKNIIKTVSTPAGCISAKGGRGGVGATATSGNIGGGGGGAGAGGGYIYLAYASVAGPTVTNLLDASGGDGGIGGNGFGTGLGGGGGGGGSGGRIRVHRTLDQVGTTTIGVAGAAGSANVGITGGAAGAGGACRRSLQELL